MTTSVCQDRQGPIWPLGSIAVATPGTPVNIMSLVDSANVNAPETATSTKSDEYTSRCQQITFQGYKSNSGTGMVANTGNIYIIKKDKGSSNRTDTGAIIWVLAPGQTWTLGSAALNLDVFSPYEYYVDADTANDAAQVSLIIQ